MTHTEHNLILTNVNSPNIQIIRKPQALKMLGISKSNFHNKINVGLLPKPISLGANSVGYFKHELTAVMVAMGTGKSEEEIIDLVNLLVEQRHQLTS
jgi:prophage regulatory protein